MDIQAPDLLTGFGMVDITPSVGEFGSFRLAPNKRSLGVHDPLYIKALYLESSGSKLLLISVDCVMLTEDTVGMIRNAVQKSVDLADSQILVAATHTHNGAETFAEEPVADFSLQIRCIVNSAARTARIAVDSSCSARAGWGHVCVSGIAKNRFEARLENGDIDKVDDRIDVLKIEDADGTYMGVLWHFAAHATACMKDSYMNSADYYGVVNRMLEEQLGGFAVFFNGAAGNINPQLGERTFEKAENTGRNIGAKLIDAIPFVTTNDGHLMLSSNSAQIQMPITEKRSSLVLQDDREGIVDYFGSIDSLALSTLEDYDRRWPEYQRLRTSWWRHKLVEEFANVDYETITLHGYRIGDCLILSVPGEIFIEHQIELQQAFGDVRAMIFGYANGYVGYIPTPEAFDVPAYETEPTYLQRAGKYAGQIITAKGIELLRGLCCLPDGETNCA